MINPRHLSAAAASWPRLVVTRAARARQDAEDAEDLQSCCHASGLHLRDCERTSRHLAAADQRARCREA